MNASPKKWPPLLRIFLQSLLVGLFVLFSFGVVYYLNARLAAASLAASAFIAFGFPNKDSARPRFFIGGYAAALLCGFLCNLLLRAVDPAPLEGELHVCILLCSLAVFLTAFCMFAGKIQHPPAAAMAISMVTEAEPIRLGLLVFLCILLLCLLRYLLMRWFEKHFTESE